MKLDILSGPVNAAILSNDTSPKHFDFSNRIVAFLSWRQQTTSPKVRLIFLLQPILFNFFFRSDSHQKPNSFEPFSPTNL